MGQNTATQKTNQGSLEQENRGENHINMGNKSLHGLCFSQVIHQYMLIAFHKQNIRCLAKRQFAN